MDSPAMAVRYIFSLVYGVIMTCMFAGVFRETNPGTRRKNYIIIIITTAVILVVQYILCLSFGFEFTRMTYPLHTHLVLVLVLIFLCKCPPLLAILALTMGYMATQTPNFLSRLIKLVYEDPHDIVETCIYTVLVVLLSVAVSRYLAEPILTLMKGSLVAASLFLVLPMAYYFFDYITTVWTNKLYEGDFFAVNFIPFMTCIAHLIFAFAFGRELRIRSVALSEKAVLENRMKAAESEFIKMRELSDKARIYRHDMRHHFALLQSMAEGGDITGIKQYLAENIAGLEKITPHCFCADPMLNMVLSYQAERAERLGVSYDFVVELPDTIPLTNAEVCSMVSNALENALNAVGQLPESERSVKLRLKENSGMLLFTVENPYSGKAEFKKGIPVSAEEGHGMGTKSIAAIASMHQGTCDFSTSEGIFRVRVILPPDVSR